MSARKAGAAKTYGRFVALAVAMTCAVFYVEFLVEILLSVDAGSIRDRTGLAEGLLFITPYTLAGDWWATIPATLLLGWVLMWTWPRLGMLLAYGGSSVLLLTLCTFVAIPTTLAGS